MNSTIMKPVDPGRRWQSNRRCPVCQGAQTDPSGQGIRCFGFLSDDGEYLHCSREERAGQIPQHVESLTYPHKRFGRCDCGNEHDYIGEHITEAPAPRKQGTKKTKPTNLNYTIVDEYTYKNVDGAVLAYKQRLEAHDSSGKRLDKKFTWLNAERKWGGVSGMDIPPYRIESVINSDQSTSIWFVEGERCVRLLEMNDKVAVCSPWASNHRWQVDPLYFIRRKVILLPDNDDTGLSHMNFVAEKLAPYAAEIKLVRLPLDEPGSDVIDWFANGGTMSDIETLVSQTELWQSPSFSALQSITSAIRRYREINNGSSS